MHQQPTTTAEVPRAYRVFVADDHPMVCRGLEGLLRHEPDLSVCGHAGGVTEAVAAIRKIAPHLIVVDIELKDGSGLDLISSVKAWRRSVRALVWSVYDDQIYAERALRAGATGYINKQQSPQEIVQAIRCVLRGEVYLGRPRPTVCWRRPSHRERIKEKLNLSNSTQLQQQAVRLGDGQRLNDDAAALAAKLPLVARSASRSATAKPLHRGRPRAGPRRGSWRGRAC